VKSRWAAQRAVDLIFGAIPARRPAPELIERCRLVAHRGFHSSDRTENTFAAFDACLDTGIWGIEFDVQWTADGTPVVLHDADAVRVFGRSDIRLAETSARQLAQRSSEIPTLESTLDRYRGKLHLMIEIKSATFQPRHAHTLKTLLSQLEPGNDFHLLALEPQVLDYLHMFPSTALMPVAELNTTTICSLALRRGYGGVAGHYVLLRASMRDALRQQGIGHGTGFIASSNVLRREIARGAEWIFTDRPGILLGALQKMGGADAKI